MPRQKVFPVYGAAMRQQLRWLARMVSVRVKTNVRFREGKCRIVWASMHKTALGLRYNRLVRLRQRLR
jgi:hypothetical protein